MPIELVLPSDNTRVDVGSLEYPRYVSPEAVAARQMRRNAAAWEDYISGNVTTPEAQEHAAKVSGQAESISPEFELASGLGLKGVLMIGKNVSKGAKKAAENILEASYQTRPHVIGSPNSFVRNKVGLTKLRHKYDELGYTDEYLLSKFPEGVTPNAPMEQAKQYFIKRLKDGNYKKHRRGEDYDAEFVARQFKTAKNPAAIEAYNDALGTNYSIPQSSSVFYSTYYPAYYPDNRAIVVEFANKYSRRQIQPQRVHEAAHSITQGRPRTEAPFNFAGSGGLKYFKKNNQEDLAARGTQLKDYFGLTKANQEITPEMLIYAQKNYIRDTGMNNNMADFLNNIVDVNQMAKWLSEYSLKKGGKVY